MSIVIYTYHDPYKRAALLISNVIKKMMKLPLSKEEQMAEEKLKKIVG